ncbi:hypothetical protein Tsubulata_002802 [Turnera subulata]|uniref:DUF668 domain-containing protein n=1 Tax=Turnera subulata TaxID=218843 RepID=A0A9Q0FPP3_9ROSI|nr:hypothetical protein Tsubulata_002802 [Turnera subulata]
MAWFSSSHNSTIHTFSRFWLEKSPPQTLQILSFETAKTMSRLLALHDFLSDHEYLKLRKESIKAEGIRYLNSRDETFLLSLACDEKLEELDNIAIAVSRLAEKCNDAGLKQFAAVYANLKQGIVDPEMPRYNSGLAEKIITKMEKYVAATSNLHEDLEVLTEMEASERKHKAWKQNEHASSRIIPHKANPVHFEEKLAFQRKQVKHFRGISLWNKTFDKSVHPMAKMICIIYMRICELFGAFVPSLPRFPKPNTRHNKHHHHGHQKIHPDPDQKHLHLRCNMSKSGPISRCVPPGMVPVRFYSQQILSLASAETFRELERKQTVIESAPPSTVGHAGLAMRYASIIILAQRYLNSPTKINDDTRGYMYELLPANVKALVRRKLRSRWSKAEKRGCEIDHALAEGWREPLEEIMRWLAPMAHDTEQWHAERSMEKHRFDAKPTVLLFQTLYFSNLEKTEAAIVDVLVGLSCIYRYENRRSRGGGSGRGVDTDDFLGR